jgi:PAS domain-containing protein
MSEADQLRKAIWDMMNFANMYVLVLDEKMNIKFANYSLYFALGFEDHTDILGRCWLDFIKREDSNSISAIHQAISENTKDAQRFNEYTNDIITLKEEIISVKWFNVHINSDYNWSFSIGIETEKPIVISAESIRTYYKEVINNDRTMI